jgi:hypothetical protein
MAVSAARYVIFFAALAPFITVVNTGWAFRWIWRKLSGPRHAAAIVTLVSAFVILGITAAIASEGFRTTALSHPKPYIDEYGAAVEYMRRNNITGRIFNDYAPGGYLIWSLYPGSQVFMDGRGLYLKGFEAGRRALSDPFFRAPGTYGPPLYRKLSDEYGIDLALLPGCDRVSGVLIRLSLALLRDSQWRVVHADGSAIIFMRNTPRTNEFIKSNALPGRAGYQNILAMATAAGDSYYGNLIPGRKLSMAVGLWGMGDHQEALQWLEQYLRQVPGDRLALFMLKDIKDNLRRMGNPGEGSQAR